MGCGRRILGGRQVDDTLRGYHYTDVSFIPILLLLIASVLFLNCCLLLGGLHLPIPLSQPVLVEAPGSRAKVLRFPSKGRIRAQHCDDCSILRTHIVLLVPCICSFRPLGYTVLSQPGAESLHPLSEIRSKSMFISNIFHVN